MSKRRFAWFVAVAVIAVAAVSFAAAPGKPDDTIFSISSGESATSVARRLKDEGFIRSVVLFRLTLSRSGRAAEIRAGVHDLGGVESYGDIISRLATGGTAEHELTLKVIEGDNLNDIAATLRGIGFAGAESFFTYAGVPAVDNRTISRELRHNDWKEEFAFLADKPDEVSLEGYLFPDTYRIFADGSSADVVRRMLTRFDAMLTQELRDEARARGRTLFEIITMASIIEREVRTDDERALVSDIFWRRLDAGMPLQADSTVNYATGKGLASATYDDIQVDSRYNTYKYPGLPLGPISNPGVASIVAAVRPKANPYWYFLTDPEGKVYYGRTFEEHNENRARYLR